MDRTELYRVWQQNKDRPAFILEHREEINEHTDLSNPVPESGMHAVRHWMDRYKSVVTRQLDPENSGEDDEEGGGE